MTGIPESRRAFVFQRTSIILGGADHAYGTGNQDERFTAGIQVTPELSDLMMAMRQQRLQNPTDDDV